MSYAKTAGGVLAVHVGLLAFLFFKPASHYFVLTCVSTVVVWSAAFAVKRFRAAALFAAAAVQLAIHQVAYRVWQAELSSFWWPFAQFVALQYIIYLVIASRELPPSVHPSEPTTS